MSTSGKFIDLDEIRARRHHSETFTREYVNTFARDDMLECASALWERYYAETDAFDERTCTGRNARGVAVPASDSQFKLSQRFAKEILTEIEVERTRVGISDSRWEAARQQVMRGPR